MHTINSTEFILGLYEHLGQLMIRTFNYGFEFQSPIYADTCQVICQASSRNVQILEAKSSKCFCKSRSILFLS